MAEKPLDLWFEKFQHTGVDWRYKSEAESQTLTKGWRGKKTGAEEGVDLWHRLDNSRKLPAIGQARAAAGHPAAPYAAYSDSNDDTGDPEDITDTTTTDTQRCRKLQGKEVTRRQQFQEELAKDGRWKSSRIWEAVKCVWLGLADSCEETRGNVLVYSHSLPVLDALYVGLQKMGKGQTYNVMRFDGSFSATQKDTVRNLFNKNPTGNVMLVTYAAGGIGLNLQSATKVILLASQWVPATDHQTIARAVRSGQQQQVKIYRLWAP